MTSVILPPLIAIKRSNTYLEYNEEHASATLARWSGNNVFSRLAKFEVIAANTGNGGEFHLRCFHNKKFLRRRSQSIRRVTPESDEPNEDKSSWSCTMFESRFGFNANNPDSPALLLNYSGRTERIVRIIYHDEGSLSWGTTTESTSTTYEIINLESLVLLPRHLAFKGSNGNFLNVANVANVPVLRFQSSDSDVGRENTWFEVYTDTHGWAKIKSRSNQRWWRLDTSTNSIVADQPSNDQNATGFWPIKVGDEAVAFSSSSGNNHFCGLFGTDARLSAVYPSIAIEARLIPHELVLSRTVYDVNYDLANALIYDESPVSMANANSSNNTSEENNIEFKFTHTESRSSSWDTSYSWMVGVTVEKKLRIPFVGSLGLEISGEYSGSDAWGETITEETSLETTYAAVVPPLSSVTVSMMATKGSCDVPYSYSQRDLLYDGKAVVYRKDDGVFKGVNSYNFRYEVAKTSGGPSKTDETITYEEQMIPIPFEAKKLLQTTTLPSSEETIPSSEETNQEPNIAEEGTDVQEDLPAPLVEMTEEKNVPTPLDEAIDEVTIT